MVASHDIFYALFDLLHFHTILDVFPERESFQETKVQQDDSRDIPLLSCPICYEPLIRKGPSGFNLYEGFDVLSWTHHWLLGIIKLLFFYCSPSIYRSGFKCPKCNKSFSSKDAYLDLTVTSGTTEYREFKPARTELFR